MVRIFDAARPGRDCEHRPTVGNIFEKFDTQAGITAYCLSNRQKMLQAESSIVYHMFNIRVVCFEPCLTWFAVTSMRTKHLTTITASFLF